MNVPFHGRNIVPVLMTHCILVLCISCIEMKENKDFMSHLFWKLEIIAKLFIF